MKIIAKWFISAFALVVTASILEGVFVGSLYTALVVSLFLGVINIVLKPILMVLTLPINIMTLGLFTFVINGFLFWFLSTFIKGFMVDGLISAILGAFVVSVLSYFGDKLISDD